MTLGHIINGNKLLLKEATRGVSKGKWNGPGGKIDKAETPLQCIIRETYEETGITMIKPFYHGRLFFYMNGQKKLTFLGYLFSTKRFKGKARGTEEGEVKWVKISQIPYEKMWDDDKYWMELMLAGRKFDLYCYYNKENTAVTKAIIKNR
jgi:8-oxo-dGTP diphosphatase